MWTILEHPPQPFGECSVCKRHQCGEYQDENGVKRQKWLHTPIELDRGGTLVFGYQCVKSMSDNLGISKEVVENQVLLTPTDEQIGDFVRKAVNVSRNETANGYTEHGYLPGTEQHKLYSMDREGIKMWLTERNIPFVKQLGEEKLREEALKHV